MNKIKIGIIGGGWRAEFFVRCAKALPEKFEIVNMYLRNSMKAEDFSEKMNVPTTSDFSEFLSCEFDYVIVSVPRDVAVSYIERLYQANIPVLCETPPASNLEECNKLWEITKKYNGKIQVAEQYFLWPLFNSWLNVLDTGIIGEVSNVSLSVAHGYHGINLVRRFLNIENENCIICGKKYSFPTTETSSRGGRLYEGKTTMAQREKFTMEFENGKVAFFDFSGIQYFSKIRTRQMNIQGVRGEIDDEIIRYLNSKNEEVTLRLERDDMGINSIRELGNFGIMLGDKYVYKNPFQNVRLNDDEIAIAQVMCLMKEYVDTGKEFYSLKDALQDSYLALMSEKALNSPNTEIKTETQIWYK